MEDWSFFIEEFKSHRKETNEKLEKILVQTTITNGKVLRLTEFKEKAEEDIEVLKSNSSETKGRDKMIGYAFGVMTTIAIGIILWIITGK